MVAAINVPAVNPTQSIDLPRSRASATVSVRELPTSQIGPVRSSRKTLQALGAPPEVTGLGNYSRGALREEYATLGRHFAERRYLTPLYGQSRLWRCCCTSWIYGLETESYQS